MKNNNSEKIVYSIIVPVYNCELYIETAINSLNNQESENAFEIIIVNDGSTDKTKDICMRLSQENERIKYIEQKNAGVSSARNNGMKHARGKYLLFCDADDYIDNGLLHEVDHLIKKDYDIINFGYYSDVVGKMNTVSIINYKTEYYSSIYELKENFVNLWDSNMIYNIVNKVFKKSIVDKYSISFPSYNFGEDMDFVMEYLKHISNFYNSDKCFYHYIREREGAATKIYRENFFEIRKEEFRKINNYFQEWNIKKEIFFEFSCRRFSDRVLGCLENIFCSNYNFKTKYKLVRNIVFDPDVKEAFSSTKKISMKNKIVRFPINIRFTVLVYFEFLIIHVIKENMPSLFNSLKNRR